MDKEHPPKEFLKNFLRTLHFQALESNLNLEQMGRMNEILTSKYQELTNETTNIEENLKSLLDDYQLAEDVTQEINGFSLQLEELENSVQILDDLTTRIESKLKAIGKL